MLLAVLVVKKQPTATILLDVGEPVGVYLYAFFFDLSRDDSEAQVLQSIHKLQTINEVSFEG